MFKRNDWIVGITSILLGAFVVFNSSFWTESTSSDPAGPRYVPLILAWGIIVIGIIHLIGWWVEGKKDNSEESNTDFAKEWAELKPLLQIILVSIIYIFVLPFLGYLILTPLLIASILWIVKERRVKSICITSIGVTIILFLIFFYGLQIKLPLGFMKALF